MNRYSELYLRLFLRASRGSPENCLIWEEFKKGFTASSRFHTFSMLVLISLNAFSFLVGMIF